MSFTIVILAVWVPISIHNQNAREENSKQKASDAFAATGKGGVKAEEVIERLTKEIEEITDDAQQKKEMALRLLEEARKALLEGNTEKADKLIEEAKEIYDPGETGK